MSLSSSSSSSLLSYFLLVCPCLDVFFSLSSVFFSGHGVTLSLNPPSCLHLLSSHWLLPLTHHPLCSLLTQTSFHLTSVSHSLTVLCVSLCVSLSLSLLSPPVLLLLSLHRRQTTSSSFFHSFLLFLSFYQIILGSSVHSFTASP